MSHHSQSCIKCVVANQIRMSFFRFTQFIRRREAGAQKFKTRCAAASQLSCRTPVAAVQPTTRESLHWWSHIAASSKYSLKIQIPTPTPLLPPLTWTGRVGKLCMKILPLVCLLHRLVGAWVRPARYWAAVEGQEPGCCCGGALALSGGCLEPNWFRE